MRESSRHQFASRSRQVVLICLGATFALGVGNYILWKRRAEIAGRHDEARRTGEFMLTALLNQGTIKADLTRVQVALAEIDRNLAVEADMEINLGQFYRMEKDSKVRLSQLSQLSSPPPPAGSPYRAIPITVRATGNYPDLMQFLRRIETSPRLFSIRSFNFYRGDPRSGALSLDLTIDMLGAP